MLQIILIRPGSTDFDEQGRIQGTLDIPLNPQGWQQVARTTELLRQHGLQAIYCAPSEAAAQTAHAIAEGLEVKCKTLDNLHNVDHGLWQGMRVSDVKTKHPRVFRQWQESPESVCPPQGEMLNSARLRVQQVVAKLLKKHKDGVVGLVVPDPLAAIVHSYLCEDGVGNLWQAHEGGSWEIVPCQVHAPTA